MDNYNGYSLMLVGLGRLVTKVYAQFTRHSGLFSRTSKESILLRVYGIVWRVQLFLAALPDIV